MRLLVGFDRRDGGRDALELSQPEKVLDEGIRFRSRVRITTQLIGMAPCPVLVVPRS
jgi:hypothetical protein